MYILDLQDKSLTRLGFGSVALWNMGSNQVFLERPGSLLAYVKIGDYSYDSNNALVRILYEKQQIQVIW